MRMTTTTDQAALIETARSFGPRIRALRDEIERDRRLPPALVHDLAAAGLFRLLVPRAFGGLEVDPLTWLGVVEAAARLDGSVGWVLLANAGGLCTAYLDAPAARAIVGPDAAVAISGTLVPSGRATRVDGGYRVSGRWAFASGVEHSAWHMAACVLVEGDRPLRTAEGQPQVRAFFLPTEELAVLDTWSVSGLRGTGSPGAPA